MSICINDERYGGSSEFELPPKFFMMGAENYMNNIIAKISKYCGVAILCLIFLSGCNSPNVDKQINSEIGNNDEIWVITEKTVWDGMNHQAKTLAEQFEIEHEGMSVRLDILPTNKEERNAYLENLRTQIMSGSGPDVYLLPTSDILTLEDPVKYTNVQIDHLFQDVSMTMRNGIFYDITGYYDADEALNKDGLISDIMDAGTVGDARYVLPLRFDMPVIFADNEKLISAGIDPEKLKQDYSALMNDAIEGKIKLLACGVEYNSGYSLFSNIFDYDNGSISLTTECLADYFRQYLDLKYVIGSESEHRINVSISDYIQLDYMPRRKEFPIQVTTLYYAMGYAAIEKSLDREYTMLPMQTMDGSVVAEITYYAAISANCSDPELAYEFVRLFLLEESQWEKNRPGEDQMHHIYQTYGSVGPGWPVRATGAVEYLWRTHRAQNRDVYSEKSGQASRKSTVTRVQLADEDMPVLREQIDSAVFPVAKLDRSLQSARNEIKKNRNSISDNDLISIAEELVWELKLHVAEG